jgi:hypothetical protein
MILILNLLDAPNRPFVRLINVFCRKPLLVSDVKRPKISLKILQNTKNYLYIER